LTFIKPRNRKKKITIGKG